MIICQTTHCLLTIHSGGFRHGRSAARCAIFVEGAKLLRGRHEQLRKEKIIHAAKWFSMKYRNIVWGLGNWHIGAPSVLPGA